MIVPIADVSDWYVGDVLEILGTPLLNRVKPIISKGSTFVEIDSNDDVQHLDEENSYPLGNKIINRTQTYTAYDWAQEAFIDYTFGFQAKDLANDCQGVPDNYTKIGIYRPLQPPEDFIKYFDIN